MAQVNTTDLPLLESFEGYAGYGYKSDYFMYIGLVILESTSTDVVMNRHPFIILQ